MILGISGSMSKDEDACINVMTHTVLEATGQDTELVFLKDYDIRQCGDCQACHETGECATITDDMKKIGKMMEDSEAILFAEKLRLSPVSGLMANFMNRCYPYYWNIKPDKTLRGKNAAAILSCNYSSKEHMKGNPSPDWIFEERAAFRYMELIDNFCKLVRVTMIGGVYAIGINPEYKKEELVQLGKRLVSGDRNNILTKALY